MPQKEFLESDILEVELLIKYLLTQSELVSS